MGSFRADAAPCPFRQARPLVDHHRTHRLARPAAPRALLQGFAENITGEHCELFVWAIHQQVRRPLLVVWDGLSAHATAANALQDCGDRILFERFPAYSPQLNPVEFVWSHTKHGKMANFCPLDFAQLGDRVSDTLLETRREQRLLRSFFDHADLTLDFSPLDS
ncbi:MAG: transposase [Sandaracinaceae bacterium]|nr:transposase [Sandaracinaceae bacterium]MCZ7683857.1 transposase [Sandaracinaceae bacterium]